MPETASIEVQGLHQQLERIAATDSMNLEELSELCDETTATLRQITGLLEEISPAEGASLYQEGIMVASNLLKRFRQAEQIEWLALDGLKNDAIRALEQIGNDTASSAAVGLRQSPNGPIMGSLALSLRTMTSIDAVSTLMAKNSQLLGLARTADELTSYDSFGIGLALSDRYSGAGESFPHETFEQIYGLIWSNDLRSRELGRLELEQGLYQLGPYLGFNLPRRLESDFLAATQNLDLRNDHLAGQISGLNQIAIFFKTNYGGANAIANLLSKVIDQNCPEAHKQIVARILLQHITLNALAPTLNSIDPARGEEYYQRINSLLNVSAGELTANMQQFYLANNQFTASHMYESDPFELNSLLPSLEIKPDSHILEVGCGPLAPISKFFAERGFATAGFDVVPEYVKLAGGEEQGFSVQNWHATRYKNESFEEIFCLGRTALHNQNVDQWVSFFKEMRRIAKPNAKMRIDVPSVSEGYFLQAINQTFAEIKSKGLSLQFGTIIDSIDNENYSIRYVPSLEQLQAMALSAGWVLNPAPIEQNRFNYTPSKPEMENVDNYYELTPLNRALTQEEERFVFENLKHNKTPVIGYKL